LATNGRTALTRMPRQAGFSLLELVVTMVLIALFWWILLERLSYYQEAAEKANMEYNANVFKLGLQMRIGHLMAQNQVLDYAQIARESPASWLETTVPGYRGEFDVEPTTLPGGSWYFDRSRVQLVYVPNQHRYLRPASDGSHHVRWYVKTVRPSGVAGADVTVLGVQLVPVEPYRWF